VPWDQIAFRTVKLTLKHHFECARSGQFDFHCGDIE
jgi:hypothetical protein